MVEYIKLQISLFQHYNTMADWVWVLVWQSMQCMQCC